MNVLQIELTDEQIAGLRYFAELRGMKVEAVAGEVLAEEAERLLKLQDDPLMKLAGIAIADVPDLAERHDHYLAEIYADNHEEERKPSCSFHRPSF